MRVDDGSKTTVSQFIRYYIPGILTIFFLLPVIIYTFKINIPLLTFLVLVSPSIGYLYYLVVWWRLNQKINECWTKPMEDSWDNEFKNWKSRSWFFPDVRIGYRFRRLRFLLKAKAPNSEERLNDFNINPSELRGVIDRATLDSLPHEPHQYRLDKAYGSAAVEISCLISMAFNIVYLIFILPYHQFSIQKALLIIAVILGISIVLYISRKISGMEASRAEWLQYSKVSMKEDRDLESLVAVLEDMFTDVNTNNR